MKYFAQIKKEDGVFIVSFPDLPNVNTFGETLENAKQNAEEALNGCIESDFSRNFELPEAKKYSGKNFYEIKVKPHIGIALLLKKNRNNKSQIEIAKELGISYQAYQRLENPRKCNPTVKTLEKLANIFHKELEVTIQPPDFQEQNQQGKRIKV